MDEDLIYEICGSNPYVANYIIGNDEVVVLDNGEVIVIG